MATEVDRLVTAADAPVLNESLDNIVVVTGLPIAGPEKISKLQKVLATKVFGELPPFKLQLPTDEDGTSRGFAFLEFTESDKAGDAARHAVNRFQKFQLDRNHTLHTVLLSQAETVLDTPDEFEVPAEEAYDEEKDNLQSWLLQPDCYDQFIVHHHNKFTVAFNARDAPIVVEERENWTNMPEVWSPQGSYLATLHMKGVALWGTPKWKRLQRFQHPGVNGIQFSPKENFLVSYSPDVPEDRKNPRSTIIWDVKTGEMRRGFPTIPTMGGPPWPVFHWSHDDKYFARRAENAIIVYESATMAKLNKKNIAVPNVANFSWCPTANVIAYWTPQVEAKPARVVLLSVPDLKEIATRTLVGVSSLRMFWQETGEHLAVVLERSLSRGKKKHFIDLEIFQMKKKEVPCQHVELEAPVEHLFWSKRGKRFAITERGPRSTIAFFDVQDKVELLERRESNANEVSWSPLGPYCVVALVKHSNNPGAVYGDLEFVNTDTMTVMNTQEHTNCTAINWDPTGRFCTTIVSIIRVPMDTGYMVWSFQGVPLQKHLIERFFSLQWRPRPPSLLTKADIKDIEKNWKEYQTRFEAADKMMQNKASRELIEKRRSLRNAWAEFLERKKRRLTEVAEQLKAMRPQLVEQSEEVEVTVEELVSQQEEVVA